MALPDAVMLKLARQLHAQGKFNEALSILRKMDPSPERDLLLNEDSYPAGVLDCAGDAWREAEEDLTRASMMHPDGRIKSLAHERLLLLRKRSNNPILDKWFSMGRQCSHCKSTPSLFNCACCPQYGSPMQEAELVPKDMLSPIIDELWVPAAYRSGYDLGRSNPFSRLIRLAKRGEGEEACTVLGCMLADYIGQKTELRKKTDFIVPVPTSEDRLRLRGYSIPELLANALASRFCIPVVKDVLKLNRNTRETRGLPRYLKEQILADAFAVPEGKKVTGMSILIIDDVITTGTTLTFVAFPLREYKPKAVFAAALAHTEASWTWEVSE